MTTTEIPEHILRRREAIERAERIQTKLTALKKELEAENLQEEVGEEQDAYLDILATENDGQFRIEISINEDASKPASAPRYGTVIEWNEGDVPSTKLTDEQFWFMLGIFPNFAGPDYVVENLLCREAAVRGFNYLQDARDSVEGVVSRKMVEEAAEPVDQLDEEEDIEDIFFDIEEEPILIINDIVAVKGTWEWRTPEENEIVAHFEVPFKMKGIEELAVSAAVVDGEDMLRDIVIPDALKEAGFRRSDTIDVIVGS